ncbi:MAG: AraC-like DNA-binding protein [Ulvibacter sp.]|jgi:AraC-like DNA-binding protein
MKLHIQNMVCLCCKKVVAIELVNLDMIYTSLELGEVHLLKPITKKQRKQLKKVLNEYGLRLLKDKESILVEKVVTTIIDLIHDSEHLPPVNFSVYIANQLNKDYQTISALFSKTKGVTIDHFFILHKIERAKELIMYDELSLTQISHKLHYSSVAHLSNQFKKVTGMTPTFFKGIKNKKRIPLEDL